MHNAIQRELQQRLARLERTTPAMRMGIVTDDSPLTIEIGGAGVAYSDVDRLASYTPTIGDKVRVEITGNNCLVLGEII